jgi:hypothetical protein
VLRKALAPFLGGGAAAMSPCYPTDIVENKGVLQALTASDNKYYVTKQVNR